MGNGALVVYSESMLGCLYPLVLVRALVQEGQLDLLLVNLAVNLVVKQLAKE
jgi:hypothetical protein